MYRRNVSKRGSARNFNHKTGRTKAINMRGAPMRGGYRL